MTQVFTRQPLSVDGSGPPRALHRPINARAGARTPREHLASFLERSAQVRGLSGETGRLGAAKVLTGRHQTIELPNLLAGRQSADL